MNLATQPEISSDHLGEEIPLSPITQAQQEKNIDGELLGDSTSNISTENAIPSKIESFESVSSINNDGVQSGLETIPNIDLSGVLTQAGNDSETLETSQLGNIHETVSTQADEGYKAMTNNATIGYPAEVPPAPTPVVMPNGMIQDMTANDSVVVGPEAFNMTR